MIMKNIASENNLALEAWKFSDLVSLVKTIFPFHILSIFTFFCRKMSKISYSYSALRQLSSDGFTPMVSGGFNVHAPGHIVLQKSINVPKKLKEKETPWVFRALK